VRRELLLAVGGILAGCGLGPVLPHGSWPLVSLGVGVFLIVVVTGLSIREWRDQRSRAFDLVFDGNDPQCVYLFHTTEPSYLPAVGASGAAGSYSASSSVAASGAVSAPKGIVTATRSVQCVCNRLRVTNRRKRPLNEVRVEVLDIRHVDGDRQDRLHHHYLKWMHDDSPGHPFSFGGKLLDPDRAEYIDFATWSHAFPTFILEQVPEHLRNMQLPAKATYIHLEVSGVDRGTRVPALDEWFLIAPTEESGLLIEGPLLDYRPAL
jgi:hypothetical protein